MKSKFAKAIARNIRVIAENTAMIAMIDHDAQGAGYTRFSESRVECTRAVDKAEQNIAALLQQPGCHQTD